MFHHETVSLSQGKNTIVEKDAFALGFSKLMCSSVVAPLSSPAWVLTDILLEMMVLLSGTTLSAHCHLELQMFSIPVGQISFLCCLRIMGSPQRIGKQKDCASKVVQVFPSLDYFAPSPGSGPSTKALWESLPVWDLWISCSDVLYQDARWDWALVRDSSPFILHCNRRSCRKSRSVIFHRVPVVDVIFLAAGPGSDLFHLVLLSQAIEKQVSPLLKWGQN